MNKQCVRCESDNLDTGFVSGKTKLGYQSDHAPSKIWDKGGHYEVRAELCIDCGFVQLIAVGNLKEMNDLKSIDNNSEPH